MLPLLLEQDASMNGVADCPSALLSSSPALRVCKVITVAGDAAIVPFAGFAPELQLVVISNSNTMVHRAKFTLAIQHEALPEVHTGDISCITTPGEMRFNPATLTEVATEPSKLDLAPQQGYNCTSGANSWPTLNYLPPGNVTLKPVGQIGDTQGTVNAPYVYVSIPSSPHMVLTVDTSKCQLQTSAGKVCVLKLLPPPAHHTVTHPAGGAYGIATLLSHLHPHLAEHRHLAS
jgi:hypothetical protein